MSDDTHKPSSYLSKSKHKKNEKHASTTQDSVGVGKEALYGQRKMVNSSFSAGGSKSTFGRRSGTR